MKQQKNKQNEGAVCPEADVFKEKVGGYVVCFQKDCPLCDRCLHYIVGQYVSEKPTVFLAVNPHHPQVGTEECTLFRPNERAMMKKGMTNFYYDMPRHMEHAIRWNLIGIFGRRTYFAMRKGTHLITPEEQEQIAAVCRQHGWQGELNYDGEQEDWLW